MRDLFTRNLGIKVIAIVLAIVLWYVAHGGLR